ncbi:hypothetical protein PG993_008136 [Apiospora rasikravindrae]|uniref:Uncharacterized protein n=1 Tax=Apiospora rasikravindrae TaxID=990691 RepID=A0ABR1T195_9PEZI
MAYQQQNQYPYAQYGGDGGVSPQQQQSPQSESSPTSYGKWESVARRLQQPPRAHVPPLQQQQQQQPWHQPPMGYAAEGIARAHHWVANNHPNPGPPPPPSVVSPLSTTGQQRSVGNGTDFQAPSWMSYRTLPPRPAPRKRRVCGVERTHFIIIMAVALLLLVSGIATGLGVGLALNNSKSAAKSSQPRTTAKSTSRQGHHESPSMYAQCGRDYKSTRGAQDLDRKVTVSMAARLDCVDECAGRQCCVGAEWGLYQGS